MSQLQHLRDYDDHADAEQTRNHHFKDERWAPQLPHLLKLPQQMFICRGFRYPERRITSSSTTELYIHLNSCEVTKSNTSSKL